MVNKNHEFIKHLEASKPYIKEACKNIMPRKISVEELEKAKLKLECAENTFMMGDPQDNHTNALKFTIAEIELNKLFVAHKLYLQQLEAEEAQSA